MELFLDVLAISALVLIGLGIVYVTTVWPIREGMWEVPAGLYGGIALAAFVAWAFFRLGLVV